ncbi:TetR/AcrR family transcriptional regulator C-terminal domain-containing protein [Streptomyces sp. NPDC048507]|uniref:TetR/AcrR family transcriptional regulator C-terminal domain-containing protein n=1 Tax=Streptomyces sp. NPDC048507 TaxID=3365560 RepID=UPI003712C09A
MDLDLDPVAGAGAWRDRLAAVLGSYTNVLFAHPSLGLAALTARPSGPNHLALVEGLLTLLQVAAATAAEQSGRDRDPGAGEDHNALAATLLGADAATHPRIAAVGADLVSGSPGERLDWIFRAVANGARDTSRGEVPAAP